jgi:hypothetical protein
MRMSVTAAVVKPFKTVPVEVNTKKTPGYCVICSRVATTHALFKGEGVVILQRYCDGCLPKADYEY